LQTPAVHDSPEQQPADDEQLWPDARHVEPAMHRPVVALHDNPEQQPPRTPVQSSPLVEQLPPPIPPAHRPPLHVFPPQQSDEELHDSPGNWHS
jgi:hypothetical protein